MKNPEINHIEKWLREYVINHNGIMTVKYGIDIVG